MAADVRQSERRRERADAAWCNAWPALAAAAVIAFGPGARFAAAQPDAHDLTAQGVEQYRAGDLRQAATLFDEALRLDHAPIEAMFNKAVTLAQLGAVDEAIDLFRNVEAMRGCPAALAQSARYNIGRLLLDQGLAKVSGDPQEAMGTLSRAEAAFRDVVRRDPRDRDAARNLEFTRMARRQIQRSLERMQEMNRQRSELADQAEQLAQQQQQAAEATRHQARSQTDRQPQADQQPPRAQPPEAQTQQGQSQQGQAPPAEPQQQGQQAPVQPEQPPDGEPPLTREQLQQMQSLLIDLTEQLQAQLEQMRRQVEGDGSQERQPQEAQQPPSTQGAPPAEPREGEAPAPPPPYQEGADLPRPSDADLREALDSAQQSLEEARREQDQASEALGRDDLDAAREHQRQAAEHLREAAEHLRPDSPEPPPAQSQQDRPDQQAPADQPQNPQPDQQPPEQPEQPQASAAPQPGEGETDDRDSLVERLLERERRTREFRDRAERMRIRRQQPVEKDW